MFHISLVGWALRVPRLYVPNILKRYVRLRCDRTQPTKLLDWHGRGRPFHNAHPTMYFMF
jgi:hypothetical protein